LKERKRERERERKEGEEIQLSIRKRRPAEDRTTKRIGIGDTDTVAGASPGRIPGQDTCQENFAGIERKKTCKC